MNSLTDLIDLAVALYTDLHANHCLICKDNQWYIWTRYETIIPADNADDRDFCHDPEEYEHAPELTEEFGTPIGYQFDSNDKTLYIWVEG